MRRAVTAALLLAAAGAQAHGGGEVQNPGLAGGMALFADPSSLLLVLVLALLLAQAEPPHVKTVLRAGLGGLLLGALLALAGLVLDLSLSLLALAFLLGGLVAWARPLPSLLRATLAAAAATGVVLMLAPAVGASLGFRLGWLAGAMAVVGLLFASLLGLLRVLLGRQRGPVKRLLLRVAGSWLATASLLAGVLELSRRMA